MARGGAHEGAWLLRLLLAGRGPARRDPRSRTCPPPCPAHVYSGGWEHFVGGGVAVFDCNGDALPDIFAAGGKNPAHCSSTHRARRPALPSPSGDLPEMTGVTGAYPLDIDGDGQLDLVAAARRAEPCCCAAGRIAALPTRPPLGLQHRRPLVHRVFGHLGAGQTLPTLAIGNYVDRDDPDGPFEACDDNLLYRPDGHRLAAADPLTPGYCALSMLFSDWQRQGRADLRSSNDRHYYVRGGSGTDVGYRSRLRLLGPRTAGSRSRSGAWALPART